MPEDPREGVAKAFPVEYRMADLQSINKAA
jgi:hypothetical protein